MSLDNIGVDDQSSPGVALDETATTLHNGVEPSSANDAVASEDFGARILQGQVQMRAELEELRRIVASRLEYDATKEEAFRKLYLDLDQFRGQALFLEIRPLYLDLILLLDRLERGLQPSTQDSTWGDLLMSLRDELLEVLARRNIQRITATEPVFNARIQRAVEVEPAAHQAEHNVVARVVRLGYQADGQTLRPEDVVVRRFVAPAELSSQ